MINAIPTDTHEYICMQIGDVRTILIKFRLGATTQIKLSEEYEGMNIQAESVYMDEEMYEAAIAEDDLWPCKLKGSNEESSHKESSNDQGDSDVNEGDTPANTNHLNNTLSTIESE